MRQRSVHVACIILGSIFQSAFAEPSSDAKRFWGQWRGPSANGVAPEASPPVEWSEEKNIRWKIELPGEGHSTPIVWGDRVYIQAAIAEKSDAPSEDDKKSKEQNKDAERPREDQPGGREQSERQADRGNDNSERGERDRRGRGEGGPDGERRRRGGPGGMNRETPTETHQFVIMAFDRATGKEVWRHVARREVPHEGSHHDGSLAPASPLTDGKHLFAYFGSRGLYCFDMAGKLLWEKDFGDMKTRNAFGEGSTPVLYQDTIVVPWDHEADSFIVALDKNTGAERWRKTRDEVTTWATPLVLETKAANQVIVPATKRVRSYNLLTGDTIWECGGLGANCIPSPVASDGLVFTMSGHRDPALLAIRYENATGDLTDSEAEVWKTDRNTPYVPSPLLYGDCLYFLQKSTQILSCHDPKTGKAHYEAQRLEEIDGVYASPIGANDRVYVVGRNGTSYVLKRGPKFEVLAVNKLNDEFAASPSAAGSELYLRGRKHLYCLGSD